MAGGGPPLAAGVCLSPASSSSPQCPSGGSGGDLSPPAGPPGRGGERGACDTVQGTQIAIVPLQAIL